MVVDEIEPEFLLWSDCSNWPNNTCPGNNTSPMVESSWNMIFDLNETETEDLYFNYTEINGKLTFKNETNIHLRTNLLFVRYGSLEIGNETHPFKGSAKITLYGERDEESLSFDFEMADSNKVISNVGTIKMFG